MSDNNKPDKLLISTGSTMEANIIESLLMAYGIPIMRQHKNLGQYMEIITGSSLSGIDIYVPAELHNKATEILEAENVFQEDEVYDLQDSEPEDSTNIDKKVKSVPWLFFVIPILAVVFAAVLRLLY